MFTMQDSHGLHTVADHPQAHDTALLLLQTVPPSTLPPDGAAYPVPASDYLDCSLSGSWSPERHGDFPPEMRPQLGSTLPPLSVHAPPSGPEHITRHLVETGQHYLTDRSTLLGLSSQLCPHMSSVCQHSPCSQKEVKSKEVSCVDTGQMCVDTSCVLQNTVRREEDSCVDTGHVKCVSTHPVFSRTQSEEKTKKKKKNPTTWMA
ncbi:hypothetical protein Taro_032233 [Colocasia esculenta]|uniref:Uncharacterized protein n=1 Tax=Colocasia esculenta TaxID=4460 RepID=A0A843VS52_COLES|nr:hypothetical protein [Colocasia esculenta]